MPRRQPRTAARHSGNFFTLQKALPLLNEGTSVVFTRAPAKGSEPASYVTGDNLSVSGGIGIHSRP